MPWDDLDNTISSLVSSLSSFDYDSVSQTIDCLIDSIRKEPTPLPQRSAVQILQALRRKRQFTAITRLSEAIVQTAGRAPAVARHYAQALIDQGMLTPAESVLNEFRTDSRVGSADQAEIRGLLGRVYKQLYVTTAPISSAARKRELLMQSVEEYMEMYDSSRGKHTWHGINVVALMARAQRDGFGIQGLRDYKLLAKEILEKLSEKVRAASNGLGALDIATQLEALLAIGDHASLKAKATEYADAEDAHEFEYTSTLRQLTEVWQLREDAEPGSTVLPILEAARLRESGGSVRLSGDQARTQLEALAGKRKSVSLEWYKLGLVTARSVCRVENIGGFGHGTGWLVRASDFFPSEDGRLLVLTNDHVVSDTYEGALTPPNVLCNFQILGKRIQMKSIFRSSPFGELDAAFLELSEQPRADALPLCAEMVEMARPAPRMYIIGHPGGRDLEFALQDNQLVGCSDKLLHYRTPTESSSSGSPVFEMQNWEVVGIHRAHVTNIPRAKGETGAPYSANEAISMLALQKHFRSAGRVSKPKHSTP